MKRIDERTRQGSKRKSVTEEKKEKNESTPFQTPSNAIYEYTTAFLTSFAPSQSRVKLK
jgi:hypothetical protein